MRRIAVLLCAAVAAAGLTSPVSAQETTDADVVQAVVTGDLDGDGRPDVVTLGVYPIEWTEVGPVGISFFPPTEVEVTAYRGVDGTMLWRTVVDVGTPRTARLVAATVGRDATPGVLVVSGPTDDDLDDVGFAQTPTTYHVYKLDTVPVAVTALDGTGDVLWSTRFAEDRLGAFVHAEQILIGGVDGSAKLRAAAEHSVFHGIGNYTGNGSTDVLVSVSRRAQVGPVAVTALEAVAVDGTTGEPVTLLEHISASAAHVRPVRGDLNGDGLDDLLLREPEPSVGLGARSSSDGSVIWDTDQPVSRDFSYFFEVGDVTGDGVTDILMLTFPTLWETYPQRLYLLDGASGATLQERTDERLVSIGDVSGDGARDLLHISRARNSGQYRLTVVDAHGGVLRPEVVVEHDGFLTTAGDLSGDGLEDLQLNRAFIVAGRIDVRGVARLLGAPLALHEGGGYPLFASLDGAGDDLLSVPTRAGAELTIDALDGASLETLWRATVPTPSGTAADTFMQPLPAADLTGDGTPDVVMFLTDGAARSVTVLAGASGSLLWSAS